METRKADSVAQPAPPDVKKEELDKPRHVAAVGSSGKKKDRKDRREHKPAQVRKPAAVEKPVVEEKAEAPASPEKNTPVFNPVVTVESTPPGVDVFESGRLVGKTPLDVKLRPGQSSKLVLKKTGYLDRWVTVYGDKPGIHLELEPGIW